MCVRKPTLAAGAQSFGYLRGMNVRVAVLCAVALGCGGTATTRPAEPSAGVNGSTIVVRGSEISGTLLDGLRTRVPNMTIATQNTPCPLIFFRGPRSVRNAGNISVYVDGTQMADTCILQQMIASDVERVEIYPGGHVSEPGIQRNPNGIIMVFRLRQ
jgi:hypothetical protein